MCRAIGQAVVVENLPGAGGSVATIRGGDLRGAGAGVDAVVVMAV
jgi:tripartite-type tricarboxylate transporter receptor subunit TctC